MVVEGCAEETLILDSVETLRQEIEGLRSGLKGLFGRTDSGRDKAEALADRMDRTINWAIRLVRVRERYPELENVFTELDASVRRADDELFNFGKRMRLAKYV
jgi:hypothetical protein